MPTSRAKGKKQGASLLIVEDSAELRKMLAAALENEFSIHFAEEPRQALEAVFRLKPSCILLDLRLAAGSGFELCQVLSSLSFTRAIPVVILSALPADQYREICTRLGAADYFEKPADILVLKARLVELASAFERPERRTQARARLNLLVRLRGRDLTGSPFNLLTNTEDVSARGFTCTCMPVLGEGSVVEVSLKGRNDQPVGRAHAVRREWLERTWKRYNFRFLEVPQNWVCDEDTHLPSRRGEETQSMHG